MKSEPNLEQLVRNAAHAKALEDPSLRNNLQLLQEIAYTTAVESGFHDDILREDKEMDVNWVAAKIALIHSELGEATDEVRKGENHYRMYVEDGKPEGLDVELADTIVRCFDLAGSLDLDLTNAILAKMLYNRTRPHRHGGKKL